MVAAPQSEEEARHRSLALLGQIIDKATTEAAWKRKLLSDPQAAFNEGGFLPEIDALNPTNWEPDDVVGQGMGSVTQLYRCCAYWPMTTPYPIVSAT